MNRFLSHRNEIVKQVAESDRPYKEATVAVRILIQTPLRIVREWYTVV
jgi:hypothetical protein